ncbi:unnamed protein product [Peniophora sp. CBMAI 1063]|nr:unnamed protein product [Peniophora sp. CBMAI 1063]
MDETKRHNPEFLDADVILRSSDDVELLSHRRTLALASPFFATLFALPAPHDGTSKHGTEGCLPAVCMDEDEAALLRMLLSLCSNTEPAITAMDELIIAARLASNFELFASCLHHVSSLRTYTMANTQSEALRILEGVVRDAGEPFAAPDADVILRSSDNVDFRFYSLVLKLASPIFADMFLLPPPPGNSSGDEVKDGLPVICMAEDEQSMRVLLTICHPGLKPSIGALDDLAVALRLVAKFRLTNATSIDVLLRRHASDSPERVFAMAWLLQMRDLALLAARESLKAPFMLYRRTTLKIPEFHELPAHALQQLLIFQSRCRHDAARIYSDLGWLDAAQIPAQAKESGEDGGICGNCGDTRVQCRTPADRPTRVKDWWFKYVKLVAEQMQSSFNPEESHLYPAIHGALDTASGCSRCRDSAKQALETFTPLLLEQVQAIITKAENDLDLPF